MGCWIVGSGSDQDTNEEAPGSEESAAHTDTTSPSSMQPTVSFMVVQVRNYVSKYDTQYRRWRVCMRPERIGMMNKAPDFPYLALYMQFGRLARGNYLPPVTKGPTHTMKTRSKGKER